MKKSLCLLATAMTALTLSACTWDFNSCNENEKKCDGQTFSVCSSGGDWVEALTCELCDDVKGCVECLSKDNCIDETKPFCNLETKRCQPNGAVCSEGQIKCQDDKLYTCNATQSDYAETVCTEPALPHCYYPKGCVECRDNKDCKDTAKPVCNTDTKTCQPANAACAKDQKKCENDKLSICNAAQSGFDGITCPATTPHCDIIIGCVECRDRTKDCGTKGKDGTISCVQNECKGSN